MDNKRKASRNRRMLVAFRKGVKVHVLAKRNHLKWTTAYNIIKREEKREAKHAR